MRTGCYIGINSEGYLKIGQGNLSTRTRQLQVIDTYEMNNEIEELVKEALLRKELSQYYIWIRNDRFIISEDYLQDIKLIFRYVMEDMEIA